MKSRRPYATWKEHWTMRYPDVDRIAKLVPSGAASIEEALQQSPDLKQARKEDPSVNLLLDYASKIEGLARHCSQHAAGIVITPEPLTDVVPIRRIGEEQIVTQYSMEPLESLGP